MSNKYYYQSQESHQLLHVVVSIFHRGPISTFFGLDVGDSHLGVCIDHQSASTLHFLVIIQSDIVSVVWRDYFDCVQTNGRA